MLTFTKALKQRPIVMSLSVGGLMATILMVGYTTLAYPPRATLAVLWGTLKAFMTYSKQAGVSPN